MRPVETRIGDHAVVIGSSMAGMLAARVLADRFARVTIVERDHLPDAATFRAGVPQGRHVHIFLARGQRELETLFPGIGAKIVAAGAVEMDLLDDLQYESVRGSVPRFPSDLRLYLSSRPFLEWMVWREIQHMDAITVQPGYEVTAVVANAAGAVTGVRVRPRTDTLDAPTEAISADLVVDASGRDSHAPRWLAALGYGKPPETVVDAHLGYASRRYRPPNNPDRGWRALLVPELQPRIKRNGVVWPVEGGEWIVTLGGSGGDYPPTDEADFLDFARGMVHQSLYEAIKDAEPLSPIYGYRRTANRLRHFERMPMLPEGLVVTGDAVCAFNPIYGQGMTTAALGAMILRDALAQGTRDLPRRFQRALARSNAAPWLLATGSDFRVPGVEATQPPRSARLAHRYFDGVLDLITEDTAIYRAFVEVVHLLQPPSTLFRPSIAWKVGRYLLRKPRVEETQAGRVSNEEKADNEGAGG